MTQRYVPGLFDRLVNGITAQAYTLEQMKDSLARDLEALLNARAAIPEEELRGYRLASGSVLNYGLVDFAAMCLTSDVDRKRICHAVQRAIERHEPRLRNVKASLRKAEGNINRIDFVIAATLKADASAQPVQFDAVLTQSTQRYAVRRIRPAWPQ